MQNNGNKINIVIIHDQALVRDALAKSLDQHPNFEVVGEADSYQEGTEKILDKCADVALFEIDLGNQECISLITDLVSKCPKTSVLLLTDTIETSVGRKALELGIAGIFHKEQSYRSLVKAIEKIHDGEVWMDRSVIAAALNEIKKGAAPSESLSFPGASELTPREIEIITLVCEGLRTREMANRLFIAEKTVRNHLASIFSKLDVSHRLELSLFAQKHGIVQTQT